MKTDIFTGCWLVGTISLFSLAFMNPAVAQIVPDATLPNNSAVTSDGNTFEINGGTVRGGNLFHSFEHFSLPSNKSVVFNNNLNIFNIFSRVTGNSISEIDGIIQANGTANLFLLNPNGIIFGANARLDIGGSFLASTARSLRFTDETEFSATASQTEPILTITEPIALEFGENSGKIINRSVATEAGKPVGLQVLPNQTIGLIGGDLSLEGGYVTAPQGRIELGSVAGNGSANLMVTDGGMVLGYNQGQTFGEIRLLEGAVIDSSGVGGGAIQLRGGLVSMSDRAAIVANTLGNQDGGGILVQADRLVMQNGALLSAITLGDGAGGDITLQSSELVQITGRGNFREVLKSILNKTFDFNQIGDGVFTSSFGAGAAGKLTIDTGALILENGATISTSTFTAGAGGDVTVTARDFVQIINSGLLTGTDSPKPAGDLTINTPILNMQNGGMAATSTLGEGQGGDLTVNSDFIEIIGNTEVEIFAFPVLNFSLALGASGLFTSTFGSGNAGNLNINFFNITLLNRGQILSDTYSTGSGGNLSLSSINKSNIAQNLSNDHQIDSDLAAYKNTILNRLIVDNLQKIIQNHSAVTTATHSSDDASNLSLRAGTISLRGVESIISTSNAGNVNSSGRGGNLTIITDKLILQDRAQIQTVTFGSGDGGNLHVIASESIEITGALPSVSEPGELSRSGLFASSQPFGVENVGNAGNIKIETGRLSIRDRGRITVSGVRGANAGNLEIMAESIHLDSGQIRGVTEAGELGNILLTAREIQLRNGSLITTDTDRSLGGNIFINTNILAALENSDITANARAGIGGRVTVNSQGVFGTQFQEQLTPLSDITATSELGAEFNGVVDINTPDIDPSRGLQDLEEEIVDVASLINQDACRINRRSEFIVTGKGGLPASPADNLSPSDGWEDWRFSELESHQRQQEFVSDNPANLDQNYPPFAAENRENRRLATGCLLASNMDNLAFITSETLLPSPPLTTLENIHVTTRGNALFAYDNYVRHRLGLKPGDVVDTAQLLEALQKLQFDPRIAKISAELSAGVSPNTSFLSVVVEPTPVLSAEMVLDNGRSPGVGTFRRQVQLNQRQLLGLGDIASINYSNTDGSNTWDFAWSVPINARNGTISTFYSTGNSEIIEKPFDRVDIDAESRSYGLSYRQPIIQSVKPKSQTNSQNREYIRSEFALGVSATRTESQTSLLGVDFPLSPGANDRGETKLSALRFFQDALWQDSRQILAARSEFSLGLGAFDATINDSEPDSSFFAWRGQGQWVRRLQQNSNTLLVLRGDVQLAANSLLPVEQFSIGGFQSVRGYRQDALLVDNGAFASVELHYPILQFPQWRGTVQLIPFVDFGMGWNWDSGSRPNPDKNALFSTGLGVQLQMGSDFVARLDWGIPLVDVDARDRTWQENGVYFSVKWNPF